MQPPPVITRFCFVLISAFLALLPSLHGQILNPPYFNIAEGKKIHASATCGTGEGMTEPEQYCKLTGAMWSDPFSMNSQPVAGQACDYCDPNRPEKIHPPEYAVDGSSRWWQSPPLSRGIRYKEVNLTIDLGQEFHVAYVYITMANSPRPGVWVLERSTDNKTFTPWMYFADSVEDCIKFFTEESIRPITRDDQVVCESRFSKLLPLENGEIVANILENRPGAKNFTSSQTLQEFTKATNVRLRLLRPKLLGPLESAGMDPSVTRRYFYSIKDINIGGRCVCNGHASICDLPKLDPNSIPDNGGSGVLECQCEHHTTGHQCELCAPGYVQKKWRAATADSPNECEPCNCNNHTQECFYDEETDRLKLSTDIHGNKEGGGYCANCRHNTEGINCERCKFGFFRPSDRNPWDLNACSKCKCTGKALSGGCLDGVGSCLCKANYTNAPSCDQCAYGYHNYPDCPRCPCYRNGTSQDACEPLNGEKTCQCKPAFDGPDCGQCNLDHYGFPNCSSCECEFPGSESKFCHSTTGQCACKQQFSGRTCNQCAVGFYDYPTCTSCICSPQGTDKDICDQVSGQCKCKIGYSGEKCDQCAPGYFGFPNCQPCKCDDRGSQSNVCNEKGKCPCKPRFGGLKCNDCASGFYKFPECEACGCDHAGSFGQSCVDGVCRCRHNFDGIKCDRCKKGYYNFPMCESCICDPAGVIMNFPGCSEGVAGRLCECKSKVTGRYCDRCVDQYKFLSPANPEGCEPCKCNRNGTLNSLDTCNGASGQCLCKEYADGLPCEECKPGTFALSSTNYFGCTACNCNTGGSHNMMCNKDTGHCSCRRRIDGLRCDRPSKAHYVPNMYQHKLELEDGFGRQFTRVRYGFDESIFPGYSWKGYADFGEQKEVIVNTNIYLDSFYRIALAYHNPTSKPIPANITFYGPQEYDPQKISMQFPPTTSPKRVILPSDPYLGRAAEPWQIAFSFDGPALVDYVALLHQDFYEARTLKVKVLDPCEKATDPDEPCQHYSFTKLPESSIRFRRTSDENEAVNVDKLYQIDSPPIEENQIRSVQVNNMRIGKYVLVISYLSISDPSSTNGEEFLRERGSATLNVEIQSGSKVVTIPVELSECPFTFECRHVLIDEKAAPVLLEMEEGPVKIAYNLSRTLRSSRFMLTDFVFIPKADWHIDHVKPSLMCIMQNFTCLNLPYHQADGVKLNFDSGELNATNVPNYSVDNVDTKANEVDEKTDLYLRDDRTFEMKGDVSAPGYYHFILHYHQREHPSFEIDAQLQPRTGIPPESAYFPVEHCPNVAGCRSRLLFRRSAHLAGETQDFTLTMTVPANRSIKLDYIMVLEDKEYVAQKPMELKHLDRSQEFLERCAQDAYYVDSNSSEFCKRMVFTMSSAFHNGATYCKCDMDGSLSYTCEPLGGQCPCKPNVIGRDCLACRTGYWGYPNCKLCDCPTGAYCDPITGECVCPPNVVGDKCDRCAANTYGFNQILGCENCDCEAAGIRNRNFQCHLSTGQCDCGDQYTGKKCDSCKNGFYRYPSCLECRCDRRGTTEDICSHTTGRCNCKKEVTEFTCDTCRPGTYNLEASNPVGCTDCYCFGTSESCISSNKWIFTIKELDLSDWQVVSLSSNGTELKSASKLELKAGQTSASVALADPPSLKDEVFSMRFMKVSPKFLGKQINSYGGLINFTITWNREANELDTDAVESVKVILKSGKTFLHYDNQTLLKSYQNHRVSAELLERHFRHSDGSAVTRSQLMMVLVRLDGIYLGGLQEASISDFSMDSATDVEVSNGKKASRVEHCACPPNYQGSSCEECAQGYYRITTGPGLGSCVRCQCNGHTDECDPATGKCLNCQHNTEGDHCERCIAAHYGNATDGTQYDCKACPCPGPVNNFAESCHVNYAPEAWSGTLRCICKPGYMGPSCEYCAAGYFGDPLRTGKFCEPCRCNDNIDPNDPASCDSITGECTKCLNNTAGVACNYCSNGYFGDAVGLKDCKPCACDPRGTKVCNHTTGDCECHPNVIGTDCSECKPDHWGIKDKEGCSACECGIAANGTSCDLETGQCQCMPGAAGRTCNRCEAGYWNFTIHGCDSCGCIQKFSRGAVCDVNTGQCSCLPGVMGEKCDQCPERWAFVEGEGCIECGECQDALLDDGDRLNTNISETLRELQGSSSHARKRFETLRESINKFEEVTKNRTQNPPIVEEDLVKYLTSLENITAHANQLSLKHLSFLNAKNKNFFDRQKEALGYEEKFNQLKTDLVDLFRVINDSKPEQATYVNYDMEKLIFEAQTTLERLQKISLNDKMSVAEKDVSNSGKFFETAVERKNILKDHNENINNVIQRIRNLTERTDLGHLKILEVRQVTLDTEKSILKSKTLMKSLRDQTKEQADHKLEARKALNEAIKLNTDAELAIKSIDGLMPKQDVSQYKWQEKAEKINRSIAEYRESETEVKNLVQLAEKHASMHLENERNLKQIVTKELNNTFKRVQGYKISVDKLINAENMGKQLTASVLMDLVSQLDRAQSLRNASDEILRQVKVFGERLDGEYKTPNDYLVKRLSNVSANNLDFKDSVETQFAAVFADIVKKKKVLQNSLNETEAKFNSASENLRNINLTASSDQLKEMLNSSKYLRDSINNVSYVISEARTIFNQTPQTLSRLMEKALPQMATLASKLEDLQVKKRELQTRIRKARELSNQVEGGVRMGPEGHLQLHNPKDLERSSSYTKFSLHFKTEYPNGLLAYLGTPLVSGANYRSRRDSDSEEQDPTLEPDSDARDFLAVELNQGHIKVYVDLGGGVHSLSSENVVNDASWHKLVIERIGPTFKMTSTRYDESTMQYKNIDVTHATVRGFHSVLDLSGDRSRIYIGGKPPNTQLQHSIIYSPFKGNIANVMLGETRLGLWNFDRSSMDMLGIAPPTEVRANELQFNGRAHATGAVDPADFLKTTTVTLEFRTFAPEGLVVLMGGEIDYFALEIHDEKLRCVVDLGSGYIELISSQTVSDGDWHAVEVSRDNKVVALKLDNREIIDKVLAGSQMDLNINREIYLGGSPKSHNYSLVTNVKFEGCIKDVAFEARPFKFDDLNMTEGVSFGCPKTEVREALFKRNGFLEMRLKYSIGTLFQVSFKFRTELSSGLLFYAANAEDTSYFAVYLRDGMLVLKTHPGKTLETINYRYNDSVWHHLIASRLENRLRLDIDDKTQFELNVDGLSQLDIPEGAFYFGGVPSLRKPALKSHRLPVEFVGCLGDAVVHDKFQSFENRLSKENAYFLLCGDSNLTEIYSSLGENMASLDFSSSTDSPSWGPTPKKEWDEVDEYCKIPKHPGPFVDEDFIEGELFGDEVLSRREYDLDSSTTASMISRTWISLEFRAYEETGLISFISDPKTRDFLAIYMKEGNLSATWDLGSGSGSVTYMLEIGKASVTPKNSPHYPISSLKDSKWHTLEFQLEGREGTLRIDSLQAVKNVSSGNTNSLNVSPLFYLGGVDEGVVKYLNSKIGVYRSFPGCIRNLRFLNYTLNHLESRAYRVRRCPGKLEPGSFFSGKGHVACGDNVKVGSNMIIAFDIRARRRDGLLVAVYGKDRKTNKLQDYLVIAMKDDELFAVVENGKQPIRVNYTIKSDNYICDGRWHNISLTKVLNTLVLKVDNVPTPFAMGPGGVHRADTDSPLFIGGIPEDAREILSSVVSVDDFIGCMTNFEVSRFETARNDWFKVPISLSSCKVAGEVTVNGCSTKE